MVSLCYPYFTLESILPRLGQQIYVRTNRPNREEGMRHNRAVLGPVQVPTVLELGRTRLFVGGKPKYYARPFAGADGHVQAEVAAKIPPQQQSDFGVVD